MRLSQGKMYGIVRPSSIDQQMALLAMPGLPLTPDFIPAPPSTEVAAQSGRLVMSRALCPAPSTCYRLCLP